ncbi:MAG: hypothetical protein AABW48_01810 [Nanoarchaeota archaeon]
MKKLLPLILAASLAGCKYFDFTAEPIRIVEPKQEPAENDFCEKVELIDGIYLGRINWVPYVYHVDTLKDRCVLIDESKGLEIIFDNNCDNKVDFVGRGSMLYNRQELGQRASKLDLLLGLGQRLACLKNKV